ncbi:MAG TPA: ArsA-related P-loop ATPase [Myxococcota bacterium]|jgi:anion-transporting  ArsA/GET3 family ATPase|nr:ArsA-related P-loop ATPase [Myxococcota bacterium]
MKTGAGVGAAATARRYRRRAAPGKRARFTAASLDSATPRRYPAAVTIDDVIAGKRVVVAVGSGGVGKTTAAAAIGLRAAAHGRKVVVCTVDPARRLANSMGLDAMGHEAVRVDPERLAAAGLANTGELWALMLDAQRTLEDLVRRHSASPEMRERLLQNRLFRTLVERMAGTREYMSMEKLWEIDHDGRYDLIVLDTPPTASAVDFLEAPERMISAWDSPAVEWFLAPFRKAGTFSFRVLSFSTSFVLKQLARFVGTTMIEDIATFLLDLNQLFDGFQNRAREVERLLKSDRVAFVLVTGADMHTLSEAAYLRERLAGARVRLEAYVVNRLNPRFDARGGTATSAATPASAPELAERLRALGGAALADLPPDTPDALAEAMARNLEQTDVLASVDRERVEALRRDAGDTPVFAVPQLETDVHDLAALGRLATFLGERVSY